MDKKLRIGIIGCGGIAHAHMRAYLEIPEVEIVGGADIVPGKARKFLDEFGLTDAKAFDCATDLLKCELDAVSSMRSVQLKLWKHAATFCLKSPCV